MLDRLIRPAIREWVRLAPLLDAMHGRKQEATFLKSPGLQETEWVPAWASLTPKLYSLYHTAQGKGLG